MTRSTWLSGSALLLSLLATIGCSTPGDPSASDIQTETFTYRAGGADCTGYLAYDANQVGPRPGVLVVHEWWGHNEYSRRRARLLAELGYTALALDMYGDGKQASHPQDASKFMNEVLENMPAGVERFEAAQELLEAHPTTDPTRTAAIGYCFGGAVVLNMARMGKDLDAVASFHGSLASPITAQPDAVQANLLVCHGADDQMVSPQQIADFEAEMLAAGANLTFITYSDAKHGFTNPDADAKATEFGIPLGYSASADRDSWNELKTLLANTW